MNNLCRVAAYLLISIVLVACAPRPEPVATRTLAPAQPTIPSVATGTPAPAATVMPPTATAQPSPTIVAEEYFTENFDAPLNANWSTFILNGDETAMMLGVRDGRFYFDLQAKAQWAYVIYQPRVYADVRIEAVALNEGRNSNGVSLVCRHSEKGWYEFNVANDGLYNILACARTSPVSADCRFITEGGSAAINQRARANKYTATCVGDLLTLFVNDQRLNSVRDRTAAFDAGQVGFSASSFEVVPVLVGFDSFQVSQP